MKQWLIILLCCLWTCASWAGGEKLVSHKYKDVSMAEALLQLGRECKGRYVINFMYDELEDFRVTTSVRKQTVPAAIRQMIGHYPISMTVEGDSAIYVECISKAQGRLKGIVIDEDGQPLEYANVTLLSPSDSAAVGGGVTTASGRFVIPYEPRSVIARVTYVGYKPSYHRCHTDDAGTIRMELDNFALDDITITGNKDQTTKKEKKHKKRNKERQHVIIVFNDSTVIDGYLMDDLTGDKIRVDTGDGLNSKTFQVKNIRSLTFVAAPGDTVPPKSYSPVMVIDEIAGSKKAKARLLAKVYESETLLGYTSPATDYYSYETQSYSGPTKANPGGTWHTHVHQVAFKTQKYYYQVKGNSIAMPYWLLSWSPSKASMKHHIKKIFKHFPSVIETVNGNDFDSKQFFKQPEVLLPVLDQALQDGSYEAVIVAEDRHASRTDALLKVVRALPGVALIVGLLLLL